MSAEDLKQKFRDWDKEGTGIINREQLLRVFTQLDPDFPEEDIKVLFDAADTKRNGYLEYEEFINFITMTTGKRLPHGVTGGRGSENIQGCLSSILDLKPEDFDGKKALSKVRSLADLIECLDPDKNPSDYSVCQAIVLQRPAVATLLGLARQAPSDDVRSKALEALARLAFGNEAGADAIAADEAFMPAVRRVLASSLGAEQMMALLLSQAVAAASGPNVVRSAPQLLAEIAPFVTRKQAFNMTASVAFDVLVSLSFHCPTSLVDILGWPLLAQLLADDAAECHEWLSGDDLSILVTGLLCVNLLGEPEAEKADDETARLEMISRLKSGRFVDCFVQAMGAAATRREWPPNSGAFHSGRRLARSARTLANHGHAGLLVPIVRPLTKIVEDQADQETHVEALRALTDLCIDVGCLEKLISLEAFRKETLDQLTDDKQGVELNSMITGIEEMLQAAQEVLDSSRDCSHAPRVPELARLFVRFGALDSELGIAELLELFRQIPVGPAANIRSQLGSTASAKLSLRSVAIRLYGSPEVLGLWPSLMEDAAAHRHALAEVPGLPDLPGLLALFEKGAHGASSLPQDRLLEEVLPAADLPTDGDAVLEAFHDIQGKGSLDFRAFVRWLCALCVRLAKEAAAKAEEEAAEAAAESAAGAAESGGAIAKASQ